jgi:UTP--glucose-1-phosphate uridylyltransferase
MHGYIFEGTRHDIGDKLGWMKTTFELALEDPVLGPELRQYVRNLMRKYA